MNLREIIEAFQNGLIRVCLWVLAALAAGCVGLWLYRSTASAMRSLGAWSRITVFAFFSSVCVLLVGGKVRSGGGHGVPALPVVVTSATAPAQAVTEEEIVQGWREVAETNCTMDVYAMPDGVSPSFNWHKRGTFGEWARLDLGGFSFPFGTNDEAVTSFSVFNDGRIRSRPRDDEREICAVGVPMLAMQGVSRFWVADGVGGSKLLTWEYFFLNADTNAPVNAQIELFSNGDFIARSNNVERIYLRVYPFDYDGDGLENSVDPDPLVAGADAHGTNAEWYNTVCSNVLDAVATSCDPPGSGAGGTQLVESVELSWREGANSNAYYFVDVVVSNGPAPIYFTGDRDSRLGNPVIVALGGATNRVPLLIGVDYAITSPVPFTVSYPMEYMYPVLETNELCRAHIRWPLEFTITPDGFGGYVVGTSPYDPGCTFQWGSDGSGGGLRSMPMEGSSCAYSTSGNWISFNCGGNGDCGCHGCSVSGCAVLEYASFEIPTIWCGCWHPDPDDPGNGSVVTNVPAVSVSFDKAVLFYEDAYTNAPNDVVAKHSTNTTLTVSAYGGETGGMLYVSEQNIRKLVRVDGDTITFPYAAFIPPHRGMSFSIEYGAEMYSDSQGDITIMASLTPMNSGETLNDSAAITVAKIALRALTPAPLDENVSRHEYGIGEAVVCRHWPRDLQVSWSCQMGRMEEVRNDFWYLYLPLTNDIPCRPRIQSGEASYSPTISIREPIKYYCKNAANISTNLGENVAGGAGMSLELYIEPRTVCFGGIALEEVPTTTGAVGGYFDNEEFSAMWAHTRERRAGQWQNVGNDNLFILEDEAMMGEVLPPMAPDGTLTNDVSFGWRDGAIIWTIPLGWNEHGTIGETDPIKTNAVPERQTFIITPNGTLTVVKAGFFVSRGTNTQIRLERVQQ
ncbi:MAG: hypothetical protein J6V72_14000 [Kiritimatiellae bacterium]|nr:hypothetical protein [Kiritimatiellia bacterium]